MNADAILKRLRAANIPEVAIPTTLPQLGCIALRKFVEDQQYRVWQQDTGFKRKSYVFEDIAYGVDGASRVSILAALAKELCLKGEEVYYTPIIPLLSTIIRSYQGGEFIELHTDTIVVIPDFDDAFDFIATHPEGLRAFMDLYQHLQDITSFGSAVIFGMYKRDVQDWPKAFRYWADYKLESLPT